MNKFQNIKIGDLLGGVDGPGQSPADNTYTVVAKVEDRWGEHLVAVNDETGEEHKVPSLTTVGVGMYHLVGQVNNEHLMNGAIG